MTSFSHKAALRDIALNEDRIREELKKANEESLVLRRVRERDRDSIERLTAENARLARQLAQTEDELSISQRRAEWFMNEVEELGYDLQDEILDHDKRILEHERCQDVVEALQAETQGFLERFEQTMGEVASLTVSLWHSEDRVASLARSFRRSEARVATLARALESSESQAAFLIRSIDAANLATRRAEERALLYLNGVDDRYS